MVTTELTPADEKPRWCTVAEFRALQDIRAPQTVLDKRTWSYPPVTGAQQACREGASMPWAICLRLSSLHVLLSAGALPSRQNRPEQVQVLVHSSSSVLSAQGEAPHLDDSPRHAQGAVPLPAST